MINPELFDNKYKHLKSVNDIVEIYLKYYPLFLDVTNKYSSKKLIINTEKQIYNTKYQEKIHAQSKKQIFPMNMVCRNKKSKLSYLNIPGLYSESEL
jgi:hypothetical protein